MKRLMDPKTETQYQRDQMKAVKEMEEINRHCTFKPAINEMPITEDTAPLPRGYGPPMPRSARSASVMSEKRVPI